MNINAGIVFMQTYVKNLKCLLVLAETILRIAVCFLIPPMLPRFGMGGGYQQCMLAIVAIIVLSVSFYETRILLTLETTAPTVAQRWMVNAMPDTENKI